MLAALEAFLDTAAASAPAVVIAVTVLLGVGWLGGAVAREFVDRQRWAELAVAASVAAVPLVLCPMERFLQRPVAGVTVRSEAEPAEPTAGASFRAAPAVAATPRAAPSEAIAIEPDRVRRALAGAYLLVAAFLALRLAFGCLTLRRVLRRSTPIAKERLPVELPAGVAVHAGPAGIRPFCAGLLRPVIVVPGELLDDETLAAVLRHEVAHVARRDTFSQWLFAASTPLLFGHPLFWLLRARARLSAEIVADAVAAGTRHRNDYARHLLDLCERDTARPLAPVGAVPLFRRRSELSRRIEMLVDQDHQPRLASSVGSRATRIAGFAAALVAVVGSVGTAALPAQDPGREWTEEERRKVLAEKQELAAELEDLRAKLAVRAQDPGVTSSRVRFDEKFVQPTKSQEDDTLRGKLETTKVVPHTFERQGYLDVFKLLEQMSGLSIVVERAAKDIIERDGLELDMTLVSPIALENFLDLMVARSDDLTWTVRHGVVAIRTRVHSRHGTRVYRVEKGDTLERIARHTLGESRQIQRILELNPGLDPRALQPGQEIRLPPESTAPATDRPVGSQRTTTAKPAGLLAEGDAEATLSLIDRLVDARADVEIAEAELADFAARKESGVAGGDMRTADIRLRAAQRRFRLVEKFAQLELRHAEQVLVTLREDLAQAEQLERRKLASGAEVRSAKLLVERAESRLLMLRDALK